MYMQVSCGRLRWQVSINVALFRGIHQLLKAHLSKWQKEGSVQGLLVKEFCWVFPAFPG
jgi:hypothetical protein